MSKRKQYLKLITNDWNASSLKIIYTPVILHEKPVCNENDVIEMIRLYFNQEVISLQEQVMAFYLNTAYKLIGYRLISSGTTNVCLVDIKLTVSLALHCMATFVIIAHNHPSGSTKPSRQDIELTERVKNALRLIDIKLLDHVIVTYNDHLSMQREGYC